MATDLKFLLWKQNLRMLIHQGLVLSLVNTRITSKVIMSLTSKTLTLLTTFTTSILLPWIAKTLVKMEQQWITWREITPMTFSIQTITIIMKIRARSPNIHSATTTQCHSNKRLSRIRLNNHKLKITMDKEAEHICLSTDRSTSSWWIPYTRASRHSPVSKCIAMPEFHGEEATTKTKVPRWTKLLFSNLRWSLKINLVAITTRTTRSKNQIIQDLLPMPLQWNKGLSRLSHSILTIIIINKWQNLRVKKVKTSWPKVQSMSSSLHRPFTFPFRSQSSKTKIKEVLLHMSTDYR